MAKDKTERHCPACGNLHGSSLVPAAEIAHYSAQPPETFSGVFRVFVCGGRFHVIAHEEEEA